MRVSMYRELKDRAQYWVALSEFDAKYQDSPAYGSDARPLRFIKIDEQPSGKFALFEGSTVDLRRVKDIEQNPIEVEKLFNRYLSTLSNPVSLVTYRGGMGPLTERGRVLAQYDAAIKKHDLASASTYLRNFAKLVSDRKDTPLPAEVISGSAPDTSAPVKQKEELEPDRVPLSIPWLAIAATAGAAYVVYRYAKSSPSYSEDEDY